MKRSARPLCPQMNLPLVNVPSAVIPDDQQKELTPALMELLIKAAQGKIVQQENGGEDEFETHA
jgi:hypothetical protein